MTRKVDTRQIDYTSHSINYDEKRILGRRNSYLESVRLASFRRLCRRLPYTDPRVLDVGTGTGRGLSYLEQCGVRDVVGLDYTDAMLRRAIRKLREERGFDVPPGTLVRGDAYSLPFADGSFDLVVSLNFLHMFRLDLQCELIREMRRVTRAGGSILVELDSLHKGLFFSRIPEQIRKSGRTTFNTCWHIRRMFPRRAFRDIVVVGTTFPLLYRVFARFPAIGRHIESLAHYQPFGWLTERVLVSATVS